MSFGGLGPFSHNEIQIRSYVEFSKSVNLEMDPVCLNAITQSNFQADSFFPEQDIYHCDNGNFVGCSRRFHELIQSSYYATQIESLRDIGYAMHIIQDFYAHSNWVEIVENDQTIAPIENLDTYFANIIFPDLQSGLVPMLPIQLQEQYDCFFKPQEEWRKNIPGATHACMAKDSNTSTRGGRLSFGIPWKTYHELAGELAVKHSTKLLLKLYKTNHPTILRCMQPKSLEGA